ncbi:MAG: methyltransferase domain-containing protein [Streptomycetaceae bacterium]|nr:methyltransferase domain-containing protein [Streptomycetaceae bacterium]
MSGTRTGGVGENASLDLLGRDRTPFLPDRVWVERDDVWVAVDRERDPRGWQASACADIPLITQWDNGDHTESDPGVSATCSSSQPSVVKRMLDALEPRDGGRVLDVGTGTGWVAALLKDRVGARGSVVSIEVDAGLAEATRHNLAVAGVDVQVVTGDAFEEGGVDGLFDAVHVGCGMRVIPQWWIDRTRSGGMIVMPWGTDFHPYDRLLPLRVDRHSATGRLGTGLSFMKMRAQADAWRRAVGPEGWFDNTVRWEADADGADVTAAVAGCGELVLGLLLPGVVKVVTGPDADGDRTAYLYGHDSAAALGFGGGHGVSVAEFGPRALGDAFLTALRWWLDHGCPDPMGFGLTVDRRGRHVWFGSPEGPVVPPRLP